MAPLTHTTSRPLSTRTRTLLHGGLLLQGVVVAIIVFSLGREAVADSWPLWHVLARCAILAATGLLMAGTLALLHRDRPRPGNGRSPDHRTPRTIRPSLRQPHLR